MRKLLHFSILFVIIYGAWSCADDTEVGYGLLGEEDLELVFNDDLELSIRHLGPKPINSINGVFHSLGTLDDPIFGKFSSSFYVRPTLSGINPPNFVGKFDSVVLAFKVDTARYYGNPNAPHDIEIYSLLESIDDLDSIASDQIFLTDSNPVGVVHQYVPNELDSVVLIDNSFDSSSFKNVIQIKLDNSIGEAIFSDTLNNNIPSGFEALLNGFYVKSSSDNSLLQVDLSSPVSGMIFFYQTDSSESQTYVYRYSGVRSPLTFDYDVNNSALESVLESNIVSDELLYLQGHAGTILEFDISSIDQLNDPFVNFASIEVYAQMQSSIDTANFPYPVVLDLLKKDESGQFVDIIDLNIGKSVVLLDDVFDGRRQEDTERNVIRYEMKITTHVKEYLKGKEPSKIYLTVRNRVETPNNVIFYGPNHPTFGARLKLTYTKS